MILPMITAAVALSQPTAVKADPLAINGEVPTSYQACADKIIAARNAQAIEVTFDCTAKFFTTLPGYAGNTPEEDAAYGKAGNAGDAYIDLLIGRVAVSLFDDDGTDSEKTYLERAYFEAVIKQQRAADDAFCSFQYDSNVSGSIRSVYYGSCRVERIDRLATDLINLVPAQSTL